MRKITTGNTTHFKNSLDFCGRFSIGMIFGLVNSVIVFPTYVQCNTSQSQGDIKISIFV